ncbi:MAG: beta-ketoacyl-ACP synthase 3, partial [Pseudomonadota bacterium]
MYARIAGTGSYAPEKVLTNADLEKMVETSDEWIRSRTGIERRCIAADDEFTSTLAMNAARNAMDMAGVSPEEIDFLVVGTTTPDVVFPNVGCLIQEDLGIPACPSFSVEAACTGFIYGLSLADQYMRNGQAKCALVIGAETLSRVTDWNDRNTCVLFGDGAGAVVLKADDKPGIVSTHLGADGRYRHLLKMDAGPSKHLSDVV